MFASPRFANACEKQETAFSQANLFQLHQWALWRDEIGADWPPLSANLRERCDATFRSHASQPSRMQSEVATTLGAMGLSVREEVRSLQGYSLDAVVQMGGCEVAVEVDGPSHFVGHKPTGSTLLKRRQLRSAGWALVEVPYWEWNALRKEGTGAKERYLERKLGEAVGEDSGECR